MYFIVKKEKKILKHFAPIDYSIGQYCGKKATNGLLETSQSPTKTALGFLLSILFDRFAIGSCPATNITQACPDTVPGGWRSWRDCQQTGLWTGSGAWFSIHTPSWHNYFQSFSVVRKYQVNFFNLNNSVQCRKERCALKISNSKLYFKVLLVTDQTSSALSPTRVYWPFTMCIIWGESWDCREKNIFKHIIR